MLANPLHVSERVALGNNPHSVHENNESAANHESVPLGRTDPSDTLEDSSVGLPES